MNLVLIYPPISTFERYSSDIGNAGGRQIPLGIFYLASYLINLGHRVNVIDGEAHSLSSVTTAQQAISYRPDIIGISATTVAFDRACEVARKIKSLSGNIPVVIGGAHITSSPEEMVSHSEFDFAVIGEGEETLAKLLDVLGKNHDPYSIEGTAFKQNGLIKINPFRRYIDNLDSLPFPAYHLIDTMSRYNPPPCNYKKLPVANIITSRGCPNRCTFCDRSIFGRKLRTRSPENIAEEIEMLYNKYHIREIAFVDENFTTNKKLITRLFKILDSKKIFFPWTCMSRINTVDNDILRFMKAKGCWHISFGIESGNKEILKKIKKNISLNAARKVIASCHRYGILTKGFFMIGHPGETEESIDQTIQLAVDLPLDDVVVTFNTPLKGSSQFNEASKNGTLSLDNWTDFNMWRPVFVPWGLSPELLIRKHKEFYKRFYLRPRIMIRYFLSFFSAAGLRRAKALVLSLPFLFTDKK